MKIQGWKIAKQRSKKGNRIPPFVPSKNEVNFYRKYAKKASKYLEPKRALILGATPELREVAIENGLEAYAIDISKEMMVKYGAVMKYKKHKFNKEIIGNWLKMKFPTNYFSLIMGDASFINLAARKDNNKLVSICSKILENNGYMVVRQIVYPKNIKSYKNIDSLIADYRAHKLSWEDFFVQLRVLFFRKRVYNKKTYKYNVRKVFKIIDMLAKKKLLHPDEYARINEFRNELINTFYPAEKFISLFKSKRLKHLEDFHDKPHDFFNYLFMMAYQKT